MKKYLILGACGFLAAAAFADVTVSKVVMTRKSASSRDLEITYTLAGGPAIVTFDLLTNGVSIGQANITFLDGDVNRRVEAGDRSFMWLPDRSWPGHSIPSGAVPVVKAWRDSDPPEYLVSDLMNMSNNFYYTCAEAVPGGVMNPMYRTGSLLMKRIRAKGVTWTMGSNYGEPGKQSDEVPHPVTLTNDFYIGVFEMTQAQYKFLRSPYDKLGFTAEGSMRPACGEQNGLNIRDRGYLNGEPTASAMPNDASLFVAYGGCVVGNARLFTGLGYDLPSEAQWEFACRGGTTDGYWNDGTMIEPDTATDMGLKGRCLQSPEVDGDAAADATSGLLPSEGGTAVCGSYPPNVYELYDLHGNVREVCLDYYPANNSYNSIPYEERRHGVPDAKGGKHLNGSTSSIIMVGRGGAWRYDAYRARTACRCTNGNGTWTHGNANGVRLALTIDNEY